VIPEVRLSNPARRELRRLSPQDADRVLRGVERFAESGRGNTKPIRGADNLWRLRVGDYRAFLRFDDDRTRILVLSVRHRREAYRQR
jgi:mRNA interferase RelE/StbE